MTTPLRDLIEDAAHEIRSLRRTNEILNAKVEMIDLFACVLHTKAAEHIHGAGIDIAWKLDKEADRLKKEEYEKEGLGKPI